MWPCSTSTAMPSGIRQPVTMTRRSEPSGFTENTRPPPLTSRTNSLECIACPLVRGPHRLQGEQHGVALGRQLVDRAAVRLVQDAVDDLLLELGRHLRVTQGRPHVLGHRPHEMVHEMADAALASAEV